MTDTFRFRKFDIYVLGEKITLSCILGLLK
jgi:hypothetical protein